MTLAALIDHSRTQREAWRYTSLAAFADVKAQEAIAPRDITLPELLTLHRLVFVDGVLRRDLSALEALPDGFLSPCDEGPNCCALTLSGQVCLAVDPIELLFWTTAQQAATQSETTIAVTLGENSRLTLIERHGGEGVAPVAVRQLRMKIDLAAQSKLIHGKIVGRGAGALHHAHAQIAVAAGAFYDHFSLIASEGLTRCEADVALNGASAEARMLGLMLLRGAAHGDITSLIRHNAPHTDSRQFCKAVLDDKARGVFQGKVLVEKGAQKTDGHQLCRALLLSDRAEMDAKPELEIYADDVKCAHGTSIGDLDETALFYLRSRGIAAQEARAMLVEAFAGELVDQVAVGALQDSIRKEVTAWLG